ncbi:MAG: N-acetylmuramoyl-L-alanine amidase [Lachnospiraceae bacterium]|nr:N-acetylmuramoyl-L-alanine amidase [Lachnospiraceae bacterium]
MKKLFIGVCLHFVVFVPLMLYLIFSNIKSVDTGASMPGFPLASQKAYGKGVWNIERDEISTQNLTERIQDRKGYLTIPLPDKTRESDIDIETDYNTYVTVVTIQNVPEDFFHANLLSGETTGIQGIGFGYEDGIATIQLRTQTLTEPETRVANGSLFVRMRNPWELFDPIVVIDPGHGGTDTGSVAYEIQEKDITLSTAQKLVDELSMRGIKAYCTRDIDRICTEKERLELIDSVSANLVISLHTLANEHTRTDRGLSAFSDPEAQKLAKRITGRLAKELSMVDDGLIDNGSSDLVDRLISQDYSIITLNLGCITNKHDALIVSDSLNQKTIAQVIADEIVDFYGVTAIKEGETEAEN